jgi:hypothetical protein
MWTPNSLAMALRSRKTLREYDILLLKTCFPDTHIKEVRMRRIMAKLLLLAVVVVCTVATLAWAQTPLPPEGPGTVIGVDASGKATVQIKEKETKVDLPGAKVGDKVDCKVQNEKLMCTPQQR